VPTPGERQALLFVAAVAALGIGVRSCRALSPGPADADARKALATQLSRVDSAIASGGARRRTTFAEPATTGSNQTASSTGGRTRAPGSAVRGDPRPTSAVVKSPVDVDVADAADLDQLPGIGPALAARIVDDRNARGAFGSLDALQQVRGIGPVLAERLRPHVTFSHPPRPPLTEASGQRRARRP
jgi:DNA uptake protein ComE-like DNA-binding protein